MVSYGGDADAAAAAAARSAEQRLVGSIKTFAPKRGFGLLECDELGTLFVHWSQIHTTDKWPQLQVGQMVEFTPGDLNGKPAATVITQPGGLPFSTGDQRAMPVSRSLSSAFYATGVVHRFSPASGHGLITTTVDLPWPREIPQGAKVFISRENVVFQEGSLPQLPEGLAVQYRVFEDERGLSACECKNVGGSPIFVDAQTLRSPEMGNHMGQNLAGKANSSGKGKGNAKGLTPLQAKPSQKFREVATSGIPSVKRMIDKNVGGNFAPIRTFSTPARRLPPPPPPPPPGYLPQDNLWRFS